MVDLILNGLNIIIGVCPPIIIALVDNGNYVVSCLSLGVRGLETRSQRVNRASSCFAAEARQPGVDHQTDKGTYLFSVRPNSQKAFDTQLGKPLKGW